MTILDEKRPVDNNERLKKLVEAVNFDSLRLMIDPETTPSQDAVIEGVCLFLEEELNGNANSKLAFSIKSDF